MTAEEPGARIQLAVLGHNLYLKYCFSKNVLIINRERQATAQVQGRKCKE